MPQEDPRDALRSQQRPGAIPAPAQGRIPAHALTLNVQLAELQVSTILLLRPPSPLLPRGGGLLGVLPMGQGGDEPLQSHREGWRRQQSPSVASRGCHLSGT